jgi:hypothetical protein
MLQDKIVIEVDELRCGKPGFYSQQGNFFLRYRTHLYGSYPLCILNKLAESLSCPPPSSNVEIQNSYNCKTRIRLSGIVLKQRSNLFIGKYVCRKFLRESSKRVSILA